MSNCATLDFFPETVNLLPWLRERAPSAFALASGKSLTVEVRTPEEYGPLERAVTVRFFATLTAAVALVNAACNFLLAVVVVAFLPIHVYFAEQAIVADVVARALSNLAETYSNAKLGTGIFYGWLFPEAVVQDAFPEVHDEEPVAAAPEEPPAPLAAIELPAQAPQTVYYSWNRPMATDINDRLCADAMAGCWYDQAPVPAAVRNDPHEVKALPPPAPAPSAHPALLPPAQVAAPAVKVEQTYEKLAAATAAQRITITALFKMLAFDNELTLGWNKGMLAQQDAAIGELHTLKFLEFALTDMVVKGYFQKLRKRDWFVWPSYLGGHGEKKGIEDVLNRRADNKELQPLLRAFYGVLQIHERHHVLLNKCVDIKPRAWEKWFDILLKEAETRKA